MQIHVTFFQGIFSVSGKKLKFAYVNIYKLPEIMSFRRVIITIGKVSVKIGNNLPYIDFLG